MRAKLWAVSSIVFLMTTACGTEQAASTSVTSESAVPTDQDFETAAPTEADLETLSEQLAVARVATAKYVTDLALAQADGYQVITPLMPDMGVHYLNPGITEFDPAQPPILVYVPTAEGPQLGALEWVFPEEPEEPPLPGASYGEFAAACHYADGTFLPTEAEEDCAPTNAATGYAFSFWHGLLVTMHVWLWFHNPDGLFTGMNPLVASFTTDA